jgi:hypothetical protein
MLSPRLREYGLERSLEEGIVQLSDFYPQSGRMVNPLTP